MIKRRSLPAPLFSPFPKHFLKFPPIAHRGAPSDGLWSVFECAIAVAVVALARLKIGTERHRFAFAFGQQALRRQRKELGPGSKWLNQYTVGGVNYEFELAGST